MTLHDTAGTRQRMEQLQRDNAAYLKAFKHYHVASDDGSDSCAECGLDLRNPIHRRLGDDD